MHSENSLGGLQRIPLLTVFHLRSTRFRIDIQWQKKIAGLVNIRLIRDPPLVTECHHGVGFLEVNEITDLRAPSPLLTDVCLLGPCSQWAVCSGALGI